MCPNGDGWLAPLGRGVAGFTLVRVGRGDLLHLFLKPSLAIVALRRRRLAIRGLRVVVGHVTPNLGALRTNIL